MNGTTNSDGKPAERYKPNPPDLDHNRSGMCVKHGGYVGRCYRCQPEPTVETSEPRLTDDPATVALLRDLYAHATQANTKRHLYPTVKGGPIEHVWKAGPVRVAIFDGSLYCERNGELVACVKVASVHQAVNLLVDLGVLPQRFSTQYGDGYVTGYEHGAQARTDILAAMAPTTRWAVAR